MSFYHRPCRLLLDAQAGGKTLPPPHAGGKSHDVYNPAANFDRNMVIILAALLCAMICGLGLNSIIRFILRCAAGANPDAAADPPSLFRRRGLRKGLLRQIPVEVYTAGQGESAFTECPICLGEFIDGEKIRVLPRCHHCFHVKCVDVWLGSHISCPTCRRPVTEDRPQSGGGGVAMASADGR